MFDPSQFTTPQAKPLPVVFLLDVSSSMSGSKIDNLNRAVRDMLASFSDAEMMETEIWVSVITFGEEVNLHLPYTSASKVEWSDLKANGLTPMGTALKMAKAMIEDKETTPSRAYRPAVFLVSDGQPNDEWKKPLDDFIHDGRSSKCDRMAIAIGGDADEDILNRFVAGTAHSVMYVENASQLHQCFQFITMSVTTRMNSQNPNDVPEDDDIELDGHSVGGDVDAEGETKVDDTGTDDGYW